MKTWKEKMSTEEGRIEVNFWAGFVAGAVVTSTLIGILIILI